MSDDLWMLGEESARDARAYLATMTEVASGTAPNAAIPMTLLALSQVLVMGARLGAIQDIVPAERFEADTVEPELDPLRTGMANLFEGLDEYADLVDPVTSTELATGSLSNDVAVRRGPRLGGPVVVAVQLPVGLGGAGGVGAARAPVTARPHPPRRRRGDRRGRRVRRAAPLSSRGSLLAVTAGPPRAGSRCRRGRCSRHTPPCRWSGRPSCPGRAPCRRPGTPPG
jgi:hypothetical protein